MNQDIKCYLKFLNYRLKLLNDDSNKFIAYIDRINKLIHYTDDVGKITLLCALLSNITKLHNKSIEEYNKLKIKYQQFIE